MRIRLLGEVGAVTGQGVPVDVGPPKCQAVLAALALSPGTAIPAWHLVDLVWGEDPPRTAERTLQSYLTRLRKGLGPDVIVRAGAAYRLDVPPGAVDAVRFQRHLDAGDTAAALAEWAGYPLAGLTVPGLAATIDGLVERWLGAVEADLAHRALTGPQAVIGPLTELTASHPFREGLWALLMTALYQAGRQSDALAAYRTARQHLAEHLGVEPGPRLRELQAQILGQDGRLAPQPARAPQPATARPIVDKPFTYDAPAGPAADSQAVAGAAKAWPDPAGAAPDGPGNLPRRLGRLIGRDRDLKVIDDALASSPVVTLVGPGGIGKTRLALAAAQRTVTADGAWLADLAEIAAPADVPRAVAGALGIKESSGRALSEALVAALRSRRLLLLLDNCEHVIEGAAKLAQDIAEGCPDVQVLATSREGLGLGHGFERLITVAPLDPAGPGAELFGERAAAVCPTFDARASRAEVEEICRRLDGVPLAIELAAARIPTLDPADLLARLGDHLRLLVGGRRTGAERHRTLRATIGWSYDLLSPAGQLLFRRLSIFVGPFGLAAAEMVAAGESPDGQLLRTGDVAGLLGNLVERSMLMAEPGPYGRRFRLLETVRQFAAEHLAGSGEQDTLAQRHTNWCLHQLARIQQLLTGQDEAEGVARLGELAANHRAAFQRACAAGDRHLAHALLRPVVTEVVRRSRSEFGDWAERLLAITPPGDTGLVVFGLSWAAQRYKLAADPAAYERLAARYPGPDLPLVHHALASARQDYPELAAWAPLAVAELRGRGEHDLAEQFELDVGAAQIFGGNFAGGDRHVEALAGRYRADGPPTLLHWSLMLLGYSALLQGRSGRAEELIAAAIAVELPERTQSGNRPLEARALFRRGDRRQAYGVLAEQIAELTETGNVQAICIVCVEFINMMAALGRLADAALILRHLDEHAPYWANLVTGARAEVAAGLPGPQREVPGLDGLAALAYMSEVLVQLGS